MIEADLADNTDFNLLETDDGKMLLGAASSDSQLSNPGNLKIFISAANKSKLNRCLLLKKN